MKLFKDDHERAIDQVIDYFGYPSAGHDMCGDLTLELLSRDDLLGDVDASVGALDGDDDLPRQRLAFVTGVGPLDR